LTRKIKSALKYIIGLAVALTLLWVVFRDWEMQDMISRFANVKYSWVLLSVILSIFSHILRAYRWNLLLAPLGYNLSTYRTFLAVMTGYLANLVAPRLGEITRCGVLKKTDGVNMSAAIGTVVAERIFDFLGLMAIIVLGLTLEYDRLMGFFVDFVNSRTGEITLSSSGLIIIALLSLLMITVISGLWFFRLRIKRTPIYFKIRSFIREMSNGFTSVLKLRSKSGFWGSTFLIWLLYYLMAYVIVFATPSTEGLSLSAGLSILIMGGLGMSAPVQGGFGTYHILVGSVLALYGVAEMDGYFFATLIHTSQTLAVLFIGGISFVLSIFISKNKEEFVVETIK
jgi:uncharacterized protein (TIRG00374 family)